MIDGQIEAQLARPAADLDAILAGWARTLAGLRSDGTPTLYLEPIALAPPHPVQLEPDSL